MFINRSNVDCLDSSVVVVAALCLVTYGIRPIYKHAAQLPINGQVDATDLIVKHTQYKSADLLFKYWFELDVRYTQDQVRYRVGSTG